MTRLEKVLSSSHYGFVQQLEPDCQLWESFTTGFLVVLDWKRERVIPVTL